MIDTQLILVLCVSGAAATLVYFVAQLLVGSRPEDKLRDRLTDGAIDGSQKQNVGDLLKRVGESAAQPFLPSDAQRRYVIRRNLARAGIYSPSAIRAVAGAKVICLASGLSLGYAAGTFLNVDTFYLIGMALPLGGIAGYLAPSFWLKFRTSANQRSLTRALPDALDLMVVCIEAGLTVEAAMQRVGQELATAHPSLSRELGMANMETRVGVPRSQALRNMGQRTANAALQSLATMLIQAERFGTSIADALRIHSETLRINRQMAAEEMAGKASVKISFPLVLCIFPSTFIVLAGPTFIQLAKSALFN